MKRAHYFGGFIFLILVFMLASCSQVVEPPQSLSRAVDQTSVQAGTRSPNPTPNAPTVVSSTPTDTALPPATLTPIPSPTPTTPQPSQPVVAASYRTAYVAEDDVLNVRSGPGINFDIIGSLPPRATEIRITSPQAEDGWVEIAWDNLEGWVSRFYLTEAVDPETFCNAAAAQDVVEQFSAALKDRDGAALGRLVHPQRGLLVRLNWWNNEVHFDQAEVSSLFTAADKRDWGVEDGSGLPLEGPFEEIVVPLLDTDFAGSPQVHCNQLVAGASAGLIQLPFEYEAVNYYTVHRPVTGNELDWGSWVLGIEYWAGQPFLSYLVHYQWEI
jgi:uncharacterized protein YgiM (DUF1202 family)